MSLETIISKIQAESQAESQAILEKAKNQAKEILDDAHKEAEAANKVALVKGEQEAKRLTQRLLQSAELNARKELLAVKQASLDDIFNSALNKLNQLPADKYKEVIKKMILAQPLAGDEQILVAGSDSKHLGNGFLSQLNQELKSKGQKGQLELIIDDQIPRGGFILRSNMVESNNTFISLLRAKRDELELAVAQVLFTDKEAT